ncbi:uncharacterized protein HKW66_Vig0156730 [Vigna angularis]|uniref:Uncharacterized protein n=1 Tax=Phaseolus angularis TaxID=3914 RepID=A0A8T0JMN1_PHAAN|nr:uncharacterized protein HKW66_Vig0156730 [Vigna angularis]
MLSYSDCSCFFTFLPLSVHSPAEIPEIAYSFQIMILHDLCPFYKVFDKRVILFLRFPHTYVCKQGSELVFKLHKVLEFGVQEFVEDFLNGWSLEDAICSLYRDECRGWKYCVIALMSGSVGVIWPDLDGDFDCYAFTSKLEYVEVAMVV